MNRSAVSTVLGKTAGGMLAPAAVPGDRVEFSGGGTGPLAVIGEGRTSLSLSWPGRVPVPSVSGSSAVYGDILPGVNRPGFCGGSQSTGEWEYGSSTEVSGRAA